VLNVKCDPEVPPLPPHITFKEAKSFMTAAVQGDPNEGAMIKGSIKQVLSSVFAED
jgi:pyruvate dehydrogenase (quinone)